VVSGQHTTTERPPSLAQVETMDDLGRLLRQLRRREARLRGGPELTYRELAAKTGWSHGVIGLYLNGQALPATDRFDTLIRILGASPLEQGALATARDRVEELRRRPGDAASARPVPRELPPDSEPGGRTAELAQLDAALRAGAGIRVISGPAGAGKTALAVHWSHRVADRFPDGQIFLDLHGYETRPLPTHAALNTVLRSLGATGPSLRLDVAELAARYRTLVAGRRVLVVLDNARTPDQVRPLLPGSPGSLVVVTTRDDLAGLVAREGAQRLVLRPLR
jgi:transcriptional regulator with XRE-family HTH domain